MALNRLQRFLPVNILVKSNLVVSSNQLGHDSSFKEPAEYAAINSSFLKILYAW